VASLPSQVAIAHLIYSYAERIDAGDFEGVAQLFAHGEITTEGTDARFRGVDQVRGMYEMWTRRYDDGTPRTKHVTTNLVTEVDETAGRATSRSYFTVLQQTPELPLQAVISGRYHDQFERVEGRWRFTHRHMITDLAGDLTHHLLRPIGPA
jgi:ketosteroid isomerase-like protein